MSLRRVGVQVPNSEPRPRIAELALVRGDRAAARQIGLGPATQNLPVARFGLLNDPCVDPAATEFPDRLVLQLDPYSLRDVWVIAEVGEPAFPGVPAAAVLELHDVRDGAVVGGVTVILTTGDRAAPSRTPRPEPIWIGLARKVWVLPVGSSLGWRRASTSLTRGADEMLVAWIVNRSEAPLQGLAVWLEYVEAIRSDDRVWNIGNLAPGERMLVAWVVDTRDTPAGRRGVSIAAIADGHNAARIHATVGVREPRPALGGP